MHFENIDHLTINIGDATARELFMRAAASDLLVGAVSMRADFPMGASSLGTPPAIGEIWAGHGGIYCGVARGEDGKPDHHLILAVAALEEDFNWAAAQAHAKTVEADGHKDFDVPTRFESALLYANVRDKLQTSHWHWTSTQSSEDGAFVQYFYNGYQDRNGKKFAARARFVRRSVL